MVLTCDGWLNGLRYGIWDKGYLGEIFQLNTLVTGFPTIFGFDEDGLDYEYDSIRVFKYLGTDKKEILNETEFIPWFNGDEVRNVEIPENLKKEIERILPKVNL